MNRPKNAPLLAALAVAAAGLSAAAVWSLWDLSRDLEGGSTPTAEVQP